MTTKDEWIAKDLKYVWHPDTQHKQYEGENFKPILIERGDGIYVYDAEGNQYIDGVSSWWVNTLGHSVPRLNKILYEKLYPHSLFSSHVSDSRRILCFDSDTKHQAIIYIRIKKPRDSHHEVFNKS